jgi:hypothetical protein
VENESDKVLRKIQALVDKAHGGTTDAEAASLLAKADELMVKYSIEQFQLMDPNRRTTARGPVYDQPEVRTITILQDSAGVDPEMRYCLTTLFRSCAQHLFVRVGSCSVKEAKVVGYPVDLRFLDMFFLKLKMQMFSEMIVTVDPEGDWVAQIAGLKNMGYKWENIHYKMQDHPDYPGVGLPWSKRVGGLFYNKVVRYYEENNIPRNKSSNPKAWRQDYLDGYVYRIGARFREMREATLEDNPLLPDIIGQKKGVVDEAYWDEYPDRRPHPETCECDSCHVSRCRDGSCQRTVCVNARKPIRMGSYRYRKLNSDAQNAGRTAANRADLTDKGPLG